ncbi:MAG: glycosyltransferase [bacterium]
MVELFLKYKRVLKYLIAGSTGAFINLALLYFFTDVLGIWYLISSSMAFAAAFFASFFLQKFWTFSDGDRKALYKQMRAYLSVALVNLAINGSLMYIFVDKFKIWHILAQIMANGIIACESYFIYKFFIFNRGAKPKNGKIKILIATGIYPPDIGGPATILKDLSDSLSELDFEIQIITYADKAEPGKIRGISRNKNKIFRYFDYFFHLFILSLNADILYVTDIYSVGYFAYLIKKITGKKYIVRFAGDSAWESAVSSGATSDYIVDFQEKKYNSKIEKLKIRRKKIMINADCVIAVSDFMSGIAKAIGVKSGNIRIIYNSINVSDSQINKIKTDEIKQQYANSKIIMTACRLTPWKGVDGIIKILPKIKEKFGRIKFLVLGEGEELPKLKLLAEKLNVCGDVEFLGKIEHGGIINYYKAADLFILNTNYEGLSHTLLEVMKAEVPIITTDAGGNPEVIENGKEGILVKYNDLGGLGAAVFKILSDKNFAAAITDNAKIKLLNFSWKKTVGQTAEAIKEVICQK